MIKLNFFSADGKSKTIVTVSASGAQQLLGGQVPLASNVILKAGGSTSLIKPAGEMQKLAPGAKVKMVGATGMPATTSLQSLIMSGKLAPGAKGPVTLSVKPQVKANPKLIIPASMLHKKVPGSVFPKTQKSTVPVNVVDKASGKQLKIMIPSALLAPHRREEMRGIIETEVKKLKATIAAEKAAKQKEDLESKKGENNETAHTTTTDATDPKKDEASTDDTKQVDKTADKTEESRKDEVKSVNEKKTDGDYEKVSLRTNARKRSHNVARIESSDEEDDDVPLSSLLSKKDENIETPEKALPSSSGPKEMYEESGFSDSTVEDEPSAPPQKLPQTNQEPTKPEEKQIHKPWLDDAATTSETTSTVNSEVNVSSNSVTLMSSGVRITPLSPQQTPTQNYPPTTSSDLSESPYKNKSLLPSANTERNPEQYHQSTNYGLSSGGGLLSSDSTYPPPVTNPVPNSVPNPVPNPTSRPPVSKEMGFNYTDMLGLDSTSSTTQNIAALPTYSTPGITTGSMNPIGSMNPYLNSPSKQKGPGVSSGPSSSNYDSSMYSQDKRSEMYGLSTDKSYISDRLSQPAGPISTTSHTSGTSTGSVLPPTTSADIGSSLQSSAFTSISHATPLTHTPSQQSSSSDILKHLSESKTAAAQPPSYYPGYSTPSASSMFGAPSAPPGYPSYPGAGSMGGWYPPPHPHASPSMWWPETPHSSIPTYLGGPHSQPSSLGSMPDPYKDHNDPYKLSGSLTPGYGSQMSGMPTYPYSNPMYPPSANPSNSYMTPPAPTHGAPTPYNPLLNPYSYGTHNSMMPP